MIILILSLVSALAVGAVIVMINEKEKEEKKKDFLTKQELLELVHAYF